MFLHNIFFLIFLFSNIFSVFDASKGETNSQDEFLADKYERTMFSLLSDAKNLGINIRDEKSLEEKTKKSLSEEGLEIQIINNQETYDYIFECNEIQFKQTFDNVISFIKSKENLSEQEKKNNYILSKKDIDEMFKKTEIVIKTIKTKFRSDPRFNAIGPLHKIYKNENVEDKLAIVSFLENFLNKDNANCLEILNHAKDIDTAISDFFNIYQFKIFVLNKLQDQNKCSLTFSLCKKTLDSKYKKNTYFRLKDSPYCSELITKLLDTRSYFACKNGLKKLENGNFRSHAHRILSKISGKKEVRDFWISYSPLLLSIKDYSEKTLILRLNHYFYSLGEIDVPDLNAKKDLEFAIKLSKAIQEVCIASEKVEDEECCFEKDKLGEVIFFAQQAEVIFSKKLEDVLYEQFLEFKDKI